jgi:hypothetical protein
VSWAHAPVAGRRACRWSSPIASAHNRMPPPRSAVTVWASAPALARLTGFSRSGDPARDPLVPAGSLTASDAPLRPLGLARVLRLECGHPVEPRCTIYACGGGTSTIASAAGCVTQARRLLRVQRLGGAHYRSSVPTSGRGHLSPLVPGEPPSSAFRALAGRPVRLAPSEVAWERTAPRRSLAHRPKGRCRRGGR